MDDLSLSFTDWLIGARLFILTLFFPFLCECMFLDPLSRHNKDLERWTLKPPRRVTALRSWIDPVIALRSQMDRVIALRQISVTALFYLEESRKIHLSGMRARRSKDTRREKELALAPLFIYVYLSLGLSCVNWASQECCLFSLRSSLWSSDLLLFHFRGLFPSCLWPPPFWTLFPVLPTWHHWPVVTCSPLLWSFVFLWCPL